MKDFKKVISLKISEYESLFKPCDKSFIDNCKFINGSVGKLLKENTSIEKILQHIDDCIKSKKEGNLLLSTSKEELINLKMNEYESLFNKEDEFYGKDFKSNCKYINGAVKRMLKSKENEEYILSFIDDCIKFHRSTFSLLGLSQDEYFKKISEKYKNNTL